MYEFTRNKTINFKLININPGRSDSVIKTFEWKINDIIQLNNTDLLVFNTTDLNLGLNYIKIRIKNSCDSWSNECIEIINITRGNIMQKDIQVIVNAPIIDVNVTIDLTGTVSFTVSDPLGNPLPNTTISMANKTSITNAYGIATITDVVYGTYIATITTQ